ncbi:MAG: hypothetical protein P8R54_32550 [Myxococcota bacterium]|nr:hypothetical protein [Myxococcota bacterium]
MIVIPMVSLLAGCAPTDTATWRTDTAGGGEAGDETEGEGEDEDEGVEYEKALWGALEGDEGWTGFYFYDADAGGDLCDIEYEAEWAVITDCPDCIEAWSITRGGSDVWVNVDGACEAEGWTGLEGTSFGIGYTEASLWADLGTGWVAIEVAEGKREEDFAYFAVMLEE